MPVQLSFGVTNGAPCFQREIVNFVKEKDLEATSTYLDNVTVRGTSKEEIESSEIPGCRSPKNITFNEDKSVIVTKKLRIMGYIIEDGQLRPDLERPSSLKELLITDSLEALRHCMEFFAYNA